LTDLCSYGIRINQQRYFADLIIKQLVKYVLCKQYLPAINRNTLKFSLRGTVKNQAACNLVFAGYNKVNFELQIRDVAEILREHLLIIFQLHSFFIISKIPVNKPVKIFQPFTVQTINVSVVKGAARRWMHACRLFSSY
jgi:hypothetical protein